MKVVPEVVTGSEATRYGLSYDNLLAVTVKAIQELKVAHDNQAEKVVVLAVENQKLRDELAAVKKQASLTARPSQEDGSHVDPVAGEASVLTKDDMADTRELLVLVIKIGAGVGGLLVIGLCVCGVMLYRTRKRAA